MFRRHVSTLLLLLAMTGLGTGALAAAARQSPVVQPAAGARHLPAPPAPVRQSAPAAPLSRVEMSTATGGKCFPGGCLTRIWKKYVRMVVKVVWEIIKTIIDIVFNTTTESNPNIVGEVVEHHEGEEQTEEFYNSHADYENGNMAGSSFVDYGYTHVYTDYSNGSYEY